MTASVDPGNKTAANDERPIVNGTGGTVDVSSGSTYTLNDAGQFSGSGALTKTGAVALGAGSQIAPRQLPTLRFRYRG